MTQATFSTRTMSSTFKRLKAQVDTPAHAHYTVQLKNVCKVYPQTRFNLLDINLTLKQGDFLFVTGASGAGKTTLMKLMYGAEQADRGEVRVVGTNVGLLKGNRLSHLRRKLGVVFQDYKLIPRWTVAENVAFVLRSQGVPKAEIDRRLYPTLKLVGLQQRADCFPSQLSGGEQQRASIARAIVGSPKLLLADEPTGNLDQDNALQVLGILKKLNSLGITVVVTTHDMGLIQAVKAPVAQLDQGRLQVVPAEQVI
ncbi:cell division ATP-binding protein FtsE [Acaryochloris marina]|uniref:Cell division ATP-binding protein FtsE n=1 Tax=Acaryochloris marina (strain MBIC 11017) TaxID=329726 RepID=B0CDE4_ACAM1|nr:cell division ATP-binding protein FtsE [Acaryochloris marina]ABW26869.1 cell division ATP-binding protein, putative [Acaryochloris marina MBIC11017]BDM81643.1 cell division ATP-binding protein FtsE [Acaryochloris marina MBIC10699]